MFLYRAFLLTGSQPSQQGFPYYPYRPRPGIVLDDTEYKPGRQPIITRPPIGQLGDIFDITVSAIQGPGGNSGQGKPYVIPGKPIKPVGIFSHFPFQWILITSM